ncbi:putative reverse transcriptase domain-containing protein [Tanacetum coccineum]|uniref:Reverse transcriptase domain-containing protein n=1 Tax=Tanacetum coccineum TaxID=301880 RepID=A0ABQ5ITK3_9ASTR
MQEVVKKEIVKLLDTGIIYPIADSPWVSPIHCVPKKGGITVFTNENDELVPTRTAGRHAAKSLGGGTGVRVGRGGRGRRPREGNDERVDELNGQGNDQGLGANGGVEGVNGNVEGANGGNVGNQYVNVVMRNVQEEHWNYDGKGGAVVLTHLDEKMENVQDMSGCSNDQKVKYTAGSFVGKALTWWNSQIRTLSREVAVSMSWNDFKFMMIQEFCPSHEMQKLESELWNHAMVGVGHAAYTDRFHELASNRVKDYGEGSANFLSLTDEAVRNGSIKKVEKRGNVGETSKDKNGRDDNKRTRTGNVFATTVNPVGRENMGTWSKCTTCNSYHAPGGPCRTCFNCNRPGHLAKDCRGVSRNVNPVNARNPTVRACYECGSTDHVMLVCPRWNRAMDREKNHPNQVAANNGGQGRGNQGNQARGRAFMLGAEEARQDLNIVTGTFTLNDHFATTLFDSGADYSFVSTTFIPLLGLEPSELGFKYEIEIASGQLVEIDKVGNGCLIIRVEICLHCKVVRIPLSDGKVLRVVGERPKKKARFLMGIKKQEEIVVLILGATPIVKSPYRLAPSKLEELSGQLKELQDKGLDTSAESCYEDEYQRLRLELVKTFEFSYKYLCVYRRCLNLLYDSRGARRTLKVSLGTAQKEGIVC